MNNSISKTITCIFEHVPTYLLKLELEGCGSNIDKKKFDGVQ